MKDHGLLILTLILCTAAGAVVAGALSVPPDQGGTGKACFVSTAKYDELLGGKTERDFDPASVQYEGNNVPYDSEENVIYIPQCSDASGWKGNLSASGSGGDVYILNDSGEEIQECIEDGKTLKMAVISGREYMECGLVITGLPVVNMERNEETDDVEDEDVKAVHSGTIAVFDPYNEEYQSSECTFHVRGNTSTMFDKKSYRVELSSTEGKSDKKSFLGLRKDDDWILNSLSTDVSLAREKVCYDLWKKLNETEDQPVASSEIKYCELILNNEYMGVYGLMFPVDKKLMNMKPGDLLYKVNTWYEEKDAPGRLEDYNGQCEILNTNGFSYIELKYPNSDSSACNWRPFQLYEDMVFETGDIKGMEEAGVSLNIDNFILHELFCEMTRAGDNTWKNMFIAAYRDEKGRYTLNETIWDLNYSFGDSFIWDPDNGNTIFLADSTENYKLRYDRDYGYTRLTQKVDGIREDTAAKWIRWRSEGIGPEYIKDLFKENLDQLTLCGAYKRNAGKWSLGKDPVSIKTQIDDWITGRFRFLDEMYGFGG